MNPFASGKTNIKPLDANRTVSYHEDNLLVESLDTVTLGKLKKSVLSGRGSVDN